MGRLLAFLSAVALVVTGLDLDASATVIACGSTVDHSVKLTANISNCTPGPAITVIANDVVVDLNGHTVDGAGGGTGIAANGFNGVTIKNGTVKEFAIGVEFQGGDADRASGLTINAVIYGVNLDATTNASVTRSNISADTAISDSSGTLDTLSNNVVTGSTWGILLQGASSRITVSGNRLASASTQIDVLAASSVQVLGNVIRGGGTGINVSGSSGVVSIVRNVLSRGAASGIIVLSGAGQTAIGRNTVTGYASNGIVIGSGDVGISVGDNVTNGNVGYGIDAHPATDDAGGNRARGNGQFMQCDQVLCF